VPEIAPERAVRYDLRMTLFTLPFTNPIEFFISLAIGGGFVYIFQKSAMSQEQRETAWVKRFITGPNSKVIWGAATLDELKPEPGRPEFEIDNAKVDPFTCSEFQTLLRNLNRNVIVDTISMCVYEACEQEALLD
jgi:hypothetical protein